MVKRNKDIKLVNRIIWYNILNNPFSTNVPSSLENWVVVESKGFNRVYLEKLPKQNGGVDCGIFTVMYFLYITSTTKFDFVQNDMNKIRNWCHNLLVDKERNPLTRLGLNLN